MDSKWLLRASFKLDQSQVISIQHSGTPKLSVLHIPNYQLSVFAYLVRKLNIEECVLLLFLIFRF